MHGFIRFLFMEIVTPTQFRKCHYDVENHNSNIPNIVSGSGVDKNKTNFRR